MVASIYGHAFGDSDCGWVQRPYIRDRDDALSTKPVMHYQGTAYLCY